MAARFFHPLLESCMIRVRFPAMVLGLALLAGLTGCSDSAFSSNREAKERLSKKQAEFREEKAKALKVFNATDFPNLDSIERELASLEIALAASDDRGYSFSRHELDQTLRSIDHQLADLGKMYVLRDEGLALAATLKQRQKSPRSERAQFHFDEAQADLDLWTSRQTQLSLVTSAQEHFKFSEQLLARPLSVPAEENSIVAVRDKLFFEGDIDKHTGDSDTIKAHLHQAKACVLLYRQACRENGYSSSLKNLAMLEFLHVHHLRRGTNEPKGDGYDRYEEERICLVIVDRLTQVRQQINAACPAKSTVVSQLRDTEMALTAATEELAHGRKDRTGLTFKQVLAAVERLEDAFLRFKQCGE
jgi:hypothetical protein